MQLSTLTTTRRFATRVAIVALVAISTLAATSATAQAAQKNQAAYKLAMSRYTQMLKIKKSAVQAAETKAYNAFVPCWESWMQTVVSESNNNTLPSNADPYDAIDSMSQEVTGMLVLDAGNPFQNAENSLIQTQLNRRQFNSVNTARAKRLLSLVHQLYSTRVCADANKWLNDGLTDSEDPNFELTLINDSNKLNSTAYNPQLLLPTSEWLKLNNLQDRVNDRQSNLVGQVTNSVVTKLQAVAASYYSELS